MDSLIPFFPHLVTSNKQDLEVQIREVEETTHLCMVTVNVKSSVIPRVVPVRANF